MMMMMMMAFFPEKVHRMRGARSELFTIAKTPKETSSTSRELVSKTYPRI